MTNHQSVISSLYPDVCSNLILKKHGLRFFCYASPNYRIQVWSNMTADKTWTHFEMTCIVNEYTLFINTADLPIGDYEYTIRYALDNENWSWYGNMGQNGRVRVVFPTEITLPTTLPCLAQHDVNNTHLWHFKTQITSFSLGAIHHYVALIRKGSSWLTPIAGETNFDKCNKDDKWQLVMYQEKEGGNFYLWMAIEDSCWFSPGPNNTLHFHTTENNKEAQLIVCATTEKDDSTRLVQTALNYYNTAIKKDSSIANKKEEVLPESDMLDGLGYCTWNAFGKSVTMDNIQQAMKSLQSHRIPISYMIIDDGWQHVINNKMRSMDTCLQKFPNGLKKTISTLKSDFPFLKKIGIWHALWGYWDGVDVDFAKTNGYTTSQLKDLSGNEISIVTNPEKFYKDFYQFLQKAGVDFVKVDNQGSFQELHYTNLWDRYRRAMVQSSDEFLQSNVRHCMSFTPHIFFNPILSTRKKSFFRNSDDFFPDEKESHAWHIFANAINSLWSMSCPDIISDWDMFLSDHPFAEYHASSRAISGGPIYITDMPERHNIDLIQKLVGQTRHNGMRILRSEKAPQPSFDTIFGNVMEHQALICLHNIHKEKESQSERYTVCGFWNTGSSESLGVISSDVFNLKKLVVTYVVSGPDQGKLVPLRSICDAREEGDSTSVRVNGLSSSIISLSHVRSLGAISIACLGLMDKLNGTRAISHTILKKHKSKKYTHVYEAYLTHRSECCGFWVNSTLHPQRVEIDNIELDSNTDWAYTKESGLLKVDMMSASLSASNQDTFCIQIYF